MEEQEGKHHRLCHYYVWIQIQKCHAGASADVNLVGAAWLMELLMNRSLCHVFMAPIDADE